MSESIASGDVPEIEGLAMVLHAKMEHLDPTEDPDWRMLTERQRDFYRICIESLLGERDLLQRAMR